MISVICYSLFGFRNCEASAPLADIYVWRDALRRVRRIMGRHGGRPSKGCSFPQIDPHDFTIVIINPRISSGVQCSMMGDRFIVGRRGVKIIDLKLLSVHRDDVAFAVTSRWLLMQHLNRSFDNLILLLLIRVHQSIDVTEHVGKIVQINPEQTPNQNEDWPDVISPSVFASPVAD